jgi:hypothetical protein
VLWALVLAMRADAHTYGPLVRRRDEKFIVLTISFDSREEVNMSHLTPKIRTPFSFLQRISRLLITTT